MVSNLYLNLIMGEEDMVRSESKKSNIKGVFLIIKNF